MASKRGKTGPPAWEDHTATLLTRKEEGMPSEGLEPVFACTVCHLTSFKLPTLATSKRGGFNLHCNRCGKTYPSGSVYTDLTLAPQLASDFHQDHGIKATLFEHSWMSWIYDRGYRWTFKLSGWPGVKEEAVQGLNYLKPVWGGTVLDLCAGPGMFAREFLKADKFRHVITSDIAPAMLKEAAAAFGANPELDIRRVSIVRIDAGRLPFKTESLSAIFCGAGVHCVPDIVTTLAEVCRVLKPGGMFVASTAITFGSMVSNKFGEKYVRPLIDWGVFAIPDRILPIPGFSFWRPDQMKEMCTRVGFTNWQQYTNRYYIMFAVTKPTETGSNVSRN